MHCVTKQTVGYLLGYPNEISEEKIESILWFGIVWSLFEKICCKNWAKINKHTPMWAKNVDEIDTRILNAAWSHFQERYISEGKPKHSFEDPNFNFCPNDKKEWVEKILKLGHEASDREKCEALLRIIFRLRNNLFHGVKKIYGKRGIDELYDQERNFYHANRLLLEFVKLKRSGNIPDIAT